MKRKNRKRKPAVAEPTIHTRIAELRKAAGLSQRQLADKLDIDETAISHWENGSAFPRRKRLSDVAAALGVSVPDLFRDAA